MIYLDASVVVPILVNESTSPKVDDWLATDPDIGLSQWTVSEVSSALSHRQRTERLDPEEREAAEEELDRFLARGAPLIEVGNDDIQAVRSLLRFDRMLRAPDALHLAVTIRLNAALATYDKRLATAAASIGVEVVTP